jgi:hypothetical protein
LVRSLLVRVSPLAVARFIALVVIYAIQCFAIGTLAHIGEKIAKPVRSLPSLTDLNAAPAIRRPKFIFGVLASGPHPAPSLKHLGSFSYLGLTVTGIDGARSLSLEAATRLGQPPPEMRSCDGFFSAASTPAKPLNLVVGIIASPSNDSQTTKLLACDIDENGHSDLRQGWLCQVAGWR